MTAPTFETLTIMVAGPIGGHADWRLWRWSVRWQLVGSVPVAQGSEDTERDAWMRATNAATAWLDGRRKR